MSENHYDAVILGAGIAGLTVAYKLHKKGKRVLLVESSDQVGGSWRTHHFDDIAYEMGPNSIMNRCQELNDLIKESGFADEMIQKPFKESKRYLYLRNKFFSIEANPLKMFFSDLISWGAKLRILIEPFIKSNKLKEEETVFDFFERRFGIEIAENIISPSLQGVWAGDARKLSASAAMPGLYEAEQNTGSIIKGLLSKPKTKAKKKALAGISFKDGMQSFCRHLADELDEYYLEAQIENLNYENGVYSFDLDHEKFSTNNLVLASQAFASAELLQGINPSLVQVLNKIYYTPVFLCVYCIDKLSFTNLTEDFFDAFGFISSEKEDLTMGTLFASQLFDERAHKSKYLFLTIAGGSLNPQIKTMGYKEIEDRIIAEHLKYFKVDGVQEADFKIVNSKLVEKAIPQYELGHKELINEINLALEAQVGLHLTGNYLAGVSIADTVKQAVKLAEQISS